MCFSYTSACITALVQEIAFPRVTTIGARLPFCTVQSLLSSRHRLKWSSERQSLEILQTQRTVGAIRSYPADSGHTGFAVENISLDGPHALQLPGYL